MKKFSIMAYQISIGHTIINYVFLLLLLLPHVAMSQPRLAGTPIGSACLADNVAESAFDGDVTTSFLASDETGGWVGLDLGSAHIITAVGILPSDSSITYGLIEGANNSNFSDALPLMMFAETPDSRQMIYTDISVSKGFRYVRYLGPHGSYSNVTDLEFYGIEGEGDDTQFYSPTNLPTVSIYVEGLKDPQNKQTELPSIITVISADGKKLVQDSGTVRLRGNWSRTFPQKPYRFKFFSKKKLLGSPSKAKKWTLVPSYGDKTLMRNMLSFDLSRRFGMSYTPFCLPVNVWFNGDFKGNYQLCDQVEVRKGRIEIEEMDSLCVSGDSLTGGYLIEIDKYATTETSWFWSTNRNPVTIKSPDSDEILPIQKQYITNHFNKMEAELYARNFDATTGYQKYLDLASFVKRHLHQEFVGNTDAYFSVFMYKHRGDDHLYSCPVWDHDLTFDNDDRTYPINEHTDWVFKSGGSLAGDMLNFVDILLSDSSAWRALQTEWTRLRTVGALDEDQLLDIVDLYADSLQQSQVMNFWRWPIMFENVHQNPVIWGSFEAEVDNIKNYIKKRILWMDNMLSCSFEDYELSVSSAGWTTLYIPYTANIPDGLTAYIVSDIIDDTLLLQEVDMIEANKPYLVKGAPGLYTISGYKIPEWDAQNSGLLTGTIKEILAPTDSYVLQNLNGVVGFYKVISGKAPTIMANRAYLNISPSDFDAPKRYYEIEVFEETYRQDAIELESNDDSKLRVYNLRGDLIFEGLPSDPTSSETLNNLPKGIYVTRIADREYKKIYK